MRPWPAGTVTAVIPTLNAATVLPGALAALGGWADVVVSDGGSTDGTPDVARAAGAVVVTGPRGRGVQIAAGIAAARSPWLLLLHADTRLAPGWAAPAAAHMRTVPDRAGYFRFALDSADPRARRLEHMVAWRCRVLAMPYGDQGLLIGRDVLDAAGGVRSLSLMEDVDLVRRLGRNRLAPLAVDALTDAGRWERGGWLRRSARNLTCLALWRVGVPLSWIVRFYK